MSQELYYKTPSQEVFDEIKQAAIGIWKSYDDTYGYASEKIDSIKNLINVSDNWMYMVAMFDNNNQAILLRKLSPETSSLIRKALL